MAALVFIATACPASIQAAGQVQLELVGDARNTAMSFQDWGQALNNAGIKNVRIRSAGNTDKVGIDIQGTPERPLYIITGQILSRDEVLLPGERFKRSDVKRLAQWLDDLAQNGPPDKRPKLVAFGLTAAQFDRVKNELAAPVGFLSKGLTCREAVEKIARKLTLPINYEDEFVKNAADVKVENEVADLSSGTALACLLRPAGYCMAPQAAGNQIKYVIFKTRSDRKEIWPIGREPEKPLRAVLPGLYEYLNVNVQNVSAATALEAIGKRLKTPVLYDHMALAKHKIDPAKAIVSFPSARSNYSLALQKMLFPAGLKFEVRVDDAGTAFLWVTSLKPI